MTDSNLCSVKDCGKPTRAGGMCQTHYMRERRAKAAGVSGKQLRAQVAAPLRGEVDPMPTLGFRSTPEIQEALALEVAESGELPSDVLRRVLGAWAKRRLKQKD